LREIRVALAFFIEQCDGESFELVTFQTGKLDPHAEMQNTNQSIYDH
jgi:hypothetical protein